MCPDFSHPCPGRKLNTEGCGSTYPELGDPRWLPGSRMLCSQVTPDVLQCEQGRPGVGAGVSGAPPHGLRCPHLFHGELCPSGCCTALGSFSEAWDDLYTWGPTGAFQWNSPRTSELRLWYSFTHLSIYFQQSSSRALAEQALCSRLPIERDTASAVSVHGG